MSPALLRPPQKPSVKPLSPARLPSIARVPRGGKQAGDVAMDTPMEMVSDQAAPAATSREAVT